MLTALILSLAVQTAPEGCLVIGADGETPDMRRPNAVEAWNDWAEGRSARGWRARSVERRAGDTDGDVIAALRSAYEAEHGEQSDRVFDSSRIWVDREGADVFVLIAAPRGCDTGDDPDYIAALIDGETGEVLDFTGDTVVVRGSFRPVVLAGGARRD